MRNVEQEKERYRRRRHYAAVHQANRRKLAYSLGNWYLAPYYIDKNNVLRKANLCKSRGMCNVFKRLYNKKVRKCKNIGRGGHYKRVAEYKWLIY